MQLFRKLCVLVEWIIPWRTKVLFLQAIWHFLFFNFTTSGLPATWSLYINASTFGKHDSRLLAYAMGIWSYFCGYDIEREGTWHGKFPVNIFSRFETNCFRAANNGRWPVITGHFCVITDQLFCIVQWNFAKILTL